MAKRAKTNEIRDFLVRELPDHPTNVVSVTSGRFGISRQAVLRHIHKLIEQGVVRAAGKTRARRYALLPIFSRYERFSTSGLQEHVPWHKLFRPHLKFLPPNVLDICSLGFQEMLNNAIEHSEGDSASVKCVYDPSIVKIRVIDNGVGIFRKIKDELNLNDEYESILELSKGKLTTAPKEHAGQGIFFTSRMFDFFSIWSGGLYFEHSRKDGDWLIESKREFSGTFVSMMITADSKTNSTDIYDEFSSIEGGFSATRVPVILATYGDENLVSRSQARRLLVRFERFRKVILDFDGVESIGQAFADEIFRVFRQYHPDVQLVSEHTNARVRKMIQRTEIKDAEGQKHLLFPEPEIHSSFGINENVYISGTEDGNQNDK